jgi:putative aldouronate transport system permease protein
MNIVRMQSMMPLPKTVETRNRQKAGGAALFVQSLSKQRYLYLMSVPFVIWCVIFCYIPIWGWVMAFQNYKVGRGFFGQQWVGLKYFIEMFQDQRFYWVLRNTVAMSVMGLVFGFVFPIAFALFLNEVRCMPFKRTIQTVSYLPHFVSWVVAAGLITKMLSTDGGVVNIVLGALHLTDKPVQFMAEPKLFWWVVTAADVWKEMGWNSIIYLAAIAGIDQELYEAAIMDGAGRYRRMWNVTLPGIRPTIIILLVMSFGWLIQIGFEKQMLLGNQLVLGYAEVLDWYALNYGIGLGRFSYGTAVGIFKSVVSILMIFAANQFAKKMGEGRLF